MAIYISHVLNRLGKKVIKKYLNHHTVIKHTRINIKPATYMIFKSLSSTATKL